jgi:hypothetical protein
MWKSHSVCAVLARRTASRSQPAASPLYSKVITRPIPQRVSRRFRKRGRVENRAEGEMIKQPCLSQCDCEKSRQITEVIIRAIVGRARACEWKSAHRRSGRSSLGSSNTARGPSPSHRPRANISQSRDPGKKPCQREETSGDVILVWLFKQCTHTLSHTHRERQQCRPKEEEFLGVESARSGHQDAPGPVYKPSALNFIKLWL